ncbi:MAG: membrane protein insertion efficiency factor YidD [Pseudoxanthomonas sp.]
MRRILIGLIRGYQIVISPHLGQCCRFHPSCSCYAAEAIQRHGPLKGVSLAAWRVLRCNPYNHGGFDPVP